ncbi:3-dehydroquinate synthase [Psychroflexus planctonicus]|uniref:3-dehydroquinate synthase n=1 Tax=Psychroflexus planctonicus TaxID=1526575 RepID=A0ABQ1SIM9_9FLAO|nr:3-dehydroquinate synthase [Psychroflexus planctonicus]GGE41288.1 3-dehydroquinate synthase [Psychroflexus planctonicus]
MKPLQLEECAIYFENESYHAVNKHIANANYSSVFILTDSNVHESCLTEFLQNLSIQIPLEVIEIEAGEENKKLSVCNEIWKTLSDLGADRKSLIINLGGGVVTDLGGFIASTFRRGIDFIHVPTSLLAMVDAALGGKNGIDLGHLKNQVGTIVLPKMVLVITDFLRTLPQEEYRSGLAEMIKHGLIYSESYFSYFEKLQNYDAAFLAQLIHDSIKIKLNIVEADPFENNLRKTLNFGHTLGHAIESYFLANESKKRLLHGEAIAIGMILESFISFKILQLNEEELNRITQAIMPVYKKVHFTKQDIEEIIQLLKYDKKNTGSQINFVLLNKIGDCALDQEVDNELIYEAFAYYQKS